jgi:hypothetical protein
MHIQNNRVEAAFPQNRIEFGQDPEEIAEVA